ncbi:hypothetical protein WJX84_008503 [Apatococcus fuscideae]|uniref:F-box domain-containing protein n=1 Tax=Apatococcus fuscideae TaxID=2026836 RepID=A0AAW1T1U2_9CHLO
MSTREETSDLNMPRLPDDVLTRVFAELHDMRDLLCASLVSHAWRQLIDEGQWSGICEIHCHRYTCSASVGIQWAAAHCQSISHADLSHCSALGPEDLASLSHLPLKGCLIADWRTISQLPSCQSAMFQKLQLLDISYTSIPLSTSLAICIGHSSTLRRLSLAGLSNHLLMLRFLLAICSQVISMVRLLLCACHLFQTCHQLSSLSLRGCHKINGHALDSFDILSQSSRLSTVNLGDLPQISSEVVESFLKKCCHASPFETELQINLSASGRLDDRCLQALAEPLQPAPLFSSQAAHINDVSSLVTSLSLEDASAIEVESLDENSQSSPLQHQQTDTVPQQHVPDCMPSCLPDITELAIADTSRISSHALGALADAGRFNRLAALDVNFLQAAAAEPFTQLMAVFGAAGASLRVLKMDCCRVNDLIMSELGSCCAGLHTLSVVGCRGLTVEALTSLPRRLRMLTDLSVGGAMFAWGRDGLDMAAFSQLTCLKIARQNCLSDQQLVPLLFANRRSLTHITLAACSSLTDGILKALPLGISSVTLSCCDRLTGKGLHQLQNMLNLRLPGCTAITLQNLRAAVIVCQSLRVFIHSAMHNIGYIIMLFKTPPVEVYSIHTLLG